MEQKLQHSAPTFSLDYVAEKTPALFHNSSAFIRGLKGPIGSGKSVACCMEIFTRATQQAKGKDGVRRSRWAIIRNTAPELETTTIKTWLDWFPEEVFGKMNRKPPMTHRVKIHDVDLEVIFLALDRVDDAKKLLSLELTGAWVNEAREILKAVIDAATGRVGRYPSAKSKPLDHVGPWPTWYGMIMDTNPPDDSHWWYKAAEESRVEEDVPESERWEFWDQPSGLSPDAENIQNLPEGYYRKQMRNKTKEWIDVYVNGKYGFIRDGQAVYGKNYIDEMHSKANLKVNPLAQLIVGVDFGNTPAATFGQVDQLTRWSVFEEMVTPEDESLFIPQFAKMLKMHISKYYPGMDVVFYGDPSGAFRDQQGKTAFDLCKAEGIIIRPAPTNKLKPRIESVVAPLIRMVSGGPGIVIDRKKCALLRRGFNGGYHYRRLNTGGEAKYTPEPEKNRFSHVQDALQYMLCGGGEYRRLMVNSGNKQKTHISKGFSVW